ncbi:methylenetetrahydrofolate reductase [NAD(P)H] [Liquorilactobacillus satsumensis]|uniref:Methylenetetrahydrofolate reductase n=1 Tax=Liquorilactobacillus satsumensis DSM 16230 = JCM 12392 TaxID=1423801 RepID=A0A0R1UVK7_9LACO|nr:methylenetetrahydrofolate reductase [NAD(P)H] [Liquorilactobacillus satsumensis]KRL96740.1 5,10-methylenetetrahydrofolate reductase [Liquorilactobacillus satsumensis DSM 16230 = JCM 12392]
MKLTELFNSKTVFSLEVFPPRNELSSQRIIPTLEGLQEIAPDFISVTLGAGGIGHDQGTFEIADFIQNTLNIPAVVHVPCLYLSQEQVLTLLDQLKEINVTNILALRGDFIPGRKPVGDFSHANELIEFVKKERPLFSIASACYPDKHREAVSFVEDIACLRKKIDAGSDHLITQLFFNNESFYTFKEKAEIAGINVPIEAGIMPCTNKKQIERIAKVSGVPIPHKYSQMLDKYQNNKEALEDAGVAYAVEQIIDLVAHGVDGIHLYTMNHATVAQKIWRETRSIFKATSKNS